MYPTKYHKPASIAEAVAALSSGEDAMLLAGGQTLIGTMKNHLAAPSDLVDIRQIDGMSGVSSEGDTLRIGATTTHAEVATNADVKRLCPALAALVSGIWVPAVRHMVSIGGAIANNDPAADYPAGLLALGATIVTNTRELAADDFFQGMFTTALEDGEIIIAVKVAAPTKAAYIKFPQPASLYAMVGVFVADGAAGTRVAVTGAGEDGVFRHTGMETALSADWASGALDAVQVGSDGLLSDLHCAADYRASLIKTIAKRAVAAA